MEQEQENVQHGGNYEEIEADETAVRKKPAGSGKVKWSIFVGVKTRGQRRSLVLHKRPAAASTSSQCKPMKHVGKKWRSSPPPLSKEEWKSMASKTLKPKVILHTDGAGAYRSPVVQKMHHDIVEHSAKHGGPYFTKACVHKTEAGKKKTLAGTQSLDGWWKAPKLHHTGVKAQHTTNVDRRVREAQWFHWLGPAGDRWLEQGGVLAALRSKAMTAMAA